MSVQQGHMLYFKALLTGSTHYKNNENTKSQTESRRDQEKGGGAGPSS